MNNIIIFWNLFDFDKLDLGDVFFTELSFDLIMNVVENKNRFVESENRKFIDKGQVKSADSLFIEKKVRDKLKPFETNIYKVIVRNFNESRKSTAFDNVHSYYLSVLSHIDKISKEYSFKNAVFYDTPHHPYDYIAFLYLKVISVEIVVAERLPFVHSILQSQRAFFNFNFPRMDKSFFVSYKEKLSQNDKNIKTELSNDMLAYIHEYKFSNNVEYNSKHYGVRWRFHYLLKLFRERIKWHVKEKKIFSIFMKSLHYIRTFTIERIDRKNIFDIYNQLTTNIEYSTPYLYYPLHLQPEASSTPLGNEYSNQLIVIDYVTKNLQDGVALYVREHPGIFYRISSNEKIKSVRSAAFYKTLESNPKVKLVSLKSNHLDLVRNSLAVITLTGTVAFEAFGVNKPVFIFGDKYYSDFANAIKSPSKTAQFMLNNAKRIKPKRGDYEKEFVTTLSVLEEMSFEINTIKDDTSMYYSYLVKLKSLFK